MALLLIDGQALACPLTSWFGTIGDFDVDFADYVKRLLNWQSLQKFRSITFVQSNDLAVALNDEGCYPFFQRLQATLVAAGLHHDFQAQDLNNIALAILHKSSFIEDVADVQDVLVENITIQNDPLPTRRERFAYQLAHLTCLAELHAHRQTNLNPNTFQLLTRQVPAGGPNAEISCERITVQWKDGTSDDAVAVSVMNLPTVATVEDFQLKFDPYLWWQKGTATHCREAIEMATALKLNNLKTRSTLTFKFGVNFLSSANANGFIHDKQRVEKIIRACTEIITEQNLPATHILRVGKGANEQPHKRGKDTSWRRDIDNEFHLHYWLQVGKVEFADVVVHNVFSITS